MNNKKATPILVRYYIAILNSVIIIWLLYLSIIAIVRAPNLLEVYNDFGGIIPNITLVLQSTYKFFVLIPVIGALLTLDILRRKEIPDIYAAGVLIIIVFFGFLMQFILYEGLFAPFWKIIGPVGG